MAKIVNPALFIGLGGTGHKVLLQVKKSLLSNYGEMPPATDILCFDTDTQELLNAKQDLTYRKKQSGELVTEQIKFDGSEVIGISVKNPAGLLKFEHIKSWLSKIITPQIGPSDTGAKQIRQMGRFAIFENYNTQGIKEKIRAKITRLNDIAKLRNIEYEIAGDTCVHLVFSPCGGTGAGTFIDTVMIIKSIQPAIKIYGYLVMPDFYTSFPMTHSVVKNAYASLLEIDHLMGKDATKPLLNWSNYPQKPFEVDYSGSGEKFFLDAAKFFEYLYLFDNIIESGRSILDVEDVYDRIGRILYLMVSGPGAKMQSAYSNNDDYRFPSSPETNGKRRNYSSMGISQIILDKNYLTQLKISQISNRVLSAYCFSTEPLDGASLDTFIDSNSWREDRGKDMVIDRLMPRNQLKYVTDPLFPAKIKKECNVELKNNTDVFLRQWDEKTISNCNKIGDDIFNDFKTKLSDNVSSYLKNKGGLGQCKQFLTFLIGSFQGMGDEMQNESITHRSNKDKLQKDLPAYLDAIVSEENSFYPIGKDKRINETCKNYVAHSEKILLESWQITRKEAAKLFYDKSLKLLKDQQKQIQDVEQLLLEAVTEIERESQNLLNNIATERDFERYIHNYYKEILILNEEDINLEEAFRGIDFTSILKFSKVADIKNLIKNFVKTTEAVRSIDNLTVEKIIEKLPKNVIKNIVSYLDASSGVCIDVDSASFLNNSGRTEMQKFGFICVENEKETIFNEDSEIYKSISAEGGYSTLRAFTTLDPNTITMVKIAGMFPGCSIKRISDYKAQFENSTKHGGYHYSDTYFELNAMDLIDGDDNEREGLKWFVVGSALGKIYLEKGGIVLEYENKKKVPLFEGIRGKTNRELCSKYFMKNKNYLKYIEELYNNLYDENNSLTKDKFVNFYKNITSVEVLGKQFETMDKLSSEYNHIFDEKGALKEFGLANGIRPEKFED